MDREQEKLSFPTILIIIGVSALLFSGIMRVLDGAIHPIFLRIGIGCIVTGIGLSVIKHLVNHLPQSRKSTEKAR